MIAVSPTIDQRRAQTGSPSGLAQLIETSELSIEAKAEGHIEASFTTGSRWRSSTPRVAIPLDVVVEGKYLGQIAEAVVSIRNRAM